MLTMFLIGAAIGAGTGIPIGPVNVAVIDSAYRHNLRRAVGVACGGAVADFLYALLGIVGVGPLILRYSIVPPILYAFSGIVLIVYGILTVRSRPIDKSGDIPIESKNGSDRHFLNGAILGVVLIVLNPATLITWVVIVGSALAHTSTAEGYAAALGIGAGSFAWFVFVAYLADHGKKVLGNRAIWITRGVGMGLIGFGLFSMGRAAWLVFWAVTVVE
jgi:putative LysE/RhtB family amino acid efflux pump